MKKIYKILIAVGAVVVAAAVILGVLYAVFMLEKTPEAEIQFDDYKSVYVIGQPPYTDRWVFDTQIGMSSYWNEYHSGGNGIEVVLQQSKDGELIMLSEALPAMSNADDLFGSDVKVGDLTLEELRKINLAYDFTDKDGFRSYVNLTEQQLTRVTVVTLDEMLEFFGSPGRITVKLYLRFYDESQISDINAALQKIWEGVTAHSLESNAVFLPQSDAAASAADASCPDLARAATNAEAKALYRDSKSGKPQESLPYTVIYEKADKQFANKDFIRYARLQNLSVVLADVAEEDILSFRNYGVSAFASSDAEPIIQILQDAIRAERESKKAADSSVQP